MPASKKEPAKPAKPAAENPPESFEAAMQELDGLGERMDSSAVSLNGMLSDYARAAFLLRYCRQQLQALEDQVKEIDELALRSPEEAGG